MLRSTEDRPQDPAEGKPPTTAQSLRRKPPALRYLTTVWLCLAVASFGLQASAGDEDDDIEVSPGSNARAATGPSNESVIVFEADDAQESGVFAGRYDSTGQPLGVQFQVNSKEVGDQEEPDVTWLDSGQFVVVWQSEGAVYSSIQARRFDGSGQPIGVETQIDGGGQMAEGPRVASDSSSRFTVVWESQGTVFHRRFAGDGTPLGAEQPVSTSGKAEDPTVAVLPSGEQAVAWVDGFDVVARRFDPTGTAEGNEFIVNPVTLGERSEPSLSPTADGAFLAAYRSEGQDGDGSGVFARRIEDVAVGEEFQINTFTTGEQSNPSLGLNDDGQILMTWQSEGNLDGDSAGIVGRFLRPTGRPVCPDTLINTQTAGAQRVSSVAGGARQFVVTWQSESAVPLPGEVPNVRARVVIPPIFADGFESGDLSAWTNSSMNRETEPILQIDR